MALVLKPHCLERVTCCRLPQFKAGVCCARQSGPSPELVGDVEQETAADKEQLKKGREKHLKLEQEDGQARKRVFRWTDAGLPQALPYSNVSCQVATRHSVMCACPVMSTRPN